MMKAVGIHDYGPAEVLCYEDARTPEPGPRGVRYQGSCKRQSGPAVRSPKTARSEYSSSRKRVTMPNQNQLVRQTITVSLACSLIIGLLSGFVAAQDQPARGARATFFVGGVNASDANPGTASAPFATIQEAANVARPGDVVTRPNEPYFEHVDYVVERAESLGLVIGMLPTWGSYWKSNGIFTPDRARIYGRFLGERYRSKPIIWILGGDHNPETDGERAILDAMAHGIKEGDEGRHLITFHPRGPGLSSDYFHKANWLDFNMFQSSHAARDHDNGLFAEHDYQLRPPKPSLDGEPRYEDLPVGFYNASVNPDQRFDDYDVRQAAYWSLLSGACGHTYGHNSVFQMWEPGRKPVIWASTPWREAYP